MDFKGKSKEEILQWYVENVPVGSVIEWDDHVEETNETPYLQDGMICVTTNAATDRILYYIDENRHGYMLDENQERIREGFNLQSYNSAEEDKARETELKDKAFEIYKGYVVATVMYSDDELVIKSYEAAEAFLNYTHKNKVG
jgi:hypothetical protein